MLKISVLRDRNIFQIQIELINLKIVEFTL